MSDLHATAGWLLLVGPLLGAIPVAYPPLLGIWTTTRENHLRTVGAHRRAWAFLNCGFGFATLATATGLALLAGAPWDNPDTAAWIAIATIAYAAGGLLWFAVLAIRTRTTPALADLPAGAFDAGPAESLLGEAMGGLFGAFVVLTGVALVALGGGLLAMGALAAPVAAVVAIAGVLVLGWLVAAGDIIPAVAYLPTMLVGLALLLGWS
jgi:hypothetical protein